MNTFYIYTLGCKVNSYDSADIESRMVSAGFSRAPLPAGADVIIVNSCTVTAESDRKTRQTVSRAKRENPGACVVLCGCLPQYSPEKAALVADADIVTGNRLNAEIPGMIKAYLGKKEKTVQIEKHERNELFTTSDVSRIEGRTRGFLKIQDGCDRYCTYCAIPYARGFSRSVSDEAFDRELELFSSSGCKEIVLVGVNLSFYGKEYGKNLADAVERAAKTPGIVRVRLGSLEPELIDAPMLERLAKVPEFCPHFHISLQSGSDAVLKRMNRHYTSGEFAAVASEIRRLFPDAALTTDVICGFPGETEDEFLKTLDFVGKMRFEKTHIFPYSKREGTPAAKMDGQLTAAVKSERCRRLKEVCDRTRAEYVASRIGMTYEVLFETPKGGMQTGYTKNYIPVTAPYCRDLTGERRLVRIEAFDGERARASVLSDI